MAHLVVGNILLTDPFRVVLGTTEGRSLAQLSESTTRTTRNSGPGIIVLSPRFDVTINDEEG